MLKYKEVLRRELNIGDYVLLRVNSNGILLLNQVTKERNPLDNYLYNQGQEWNPTLCYKIEDNLILNYLNQYNYMDLIKLNYNNYLYDMLNRKLNIGDLVIYEIQKTGKVKFGLVNSDKTILTESGRSKIVTQVFLLQNINEYEQKIKNNLMFIGLNNIKSDLINKTVDFKNKNLSKGDIFTSNEDTAYYIYLGKSYYNIYNKVLDKNYISDERELVLKVFKYRKVGKCLNSFLTDGSKLTFEELLEMHKWENNDIVPYFLSDYDFNECKYYTTSDTFKYMARNDKYTFWSLDKYYDNLDTLSKTRFKRKKDLKIIGSIPINNIIVITEEKNLRFELVIN